MRADTDEAAIGILGGTFNPPHLAHIALARHALDEAKLDRVALIPTARTPHKPTVEDAGAEHRLQMCNLAAEGVAGVSACALEVRRGGTSYTVDTLKDIHATFPEAQLTFIVGADTARMLGSWREPQKLLELSRLAIAAREQHDDNELLELIRPLHPQARVQFLHMPEMAVSSSLVRERVCAGQSTDGLLPQAVAAYISEHGLYREPLDGGCP